MMNAIVPMYSELTDKQKEQYKDDQYVYNSTTKRLIKKSNVDLKRAVEDSCPNIINFILCEKKLSKEKRDKFLANLLCKSLYDGDKELENFVINLGVNPNIEADVLTSFYAYNLVLVQSLFFRKFTTSKKLVKMGADPDLECVPNRKGCQKYSARSLCKLEIEKYKRDIENGLGDIKMCENGYEDFLKFIDAELH